MPEHADIDFNSADHRQRKLMRVALMDLFRRERSLAMFLDEELGLVLRDEIDAGPFKEQVYELINFLVARGRLDDLMRALFESNEYAEAPTLRDLQVAWSPVSVDVAAPDRPAGEPAPAPAPLERILDGDVRRMRPLSLLSGIAAIRRRVCLLDARSGSRQSLGTGFLVAPDLVMTAGYNTEQAQCDPAERGRLTATFDYGIEAGRLSMTRSIDVGSTVVVVPPAPLTGSEVPISLDYALLRLAEPAGGQRLDDGTLRGWFDLTNTRERLREGESVFMLHHPQGGAMSLSEGVIGGVPDEPDRFAHTCPTVAGSGGAPVVDATLRLVGLHEMNKTRIPELNLAVRADRIARDLAERSVSTAAPPAREGT